MKRLHGASAGFDLDAFIGVFAGTEANSFYRQTLTRRISSAARG